jgi:copper chaperone
MISSLFSSRSLVKELTLAIQGMSCGHCLNAVNKALSSVPGLEIQSVSMGTARVRFDEARTSPEQIASAVGDAGYPADLVVK